MADKILKVEQKKYAPHDDSALRYIRRVETRLVDDGTFRYDGEPLTDSARIYSVFHSLGHRDRENAVIVFLDKLQMPIGYDIYMGGIDFVSIDPRQVFKVAANLNSSKLIILHNHPEGTPHPSGNDEMFCIQICNLCYVMGWEVVDMLIITPAGFYSFRDTKNSALLTQFQNVEVKI